MSINQSRRFDDQRCSFDANGAAVHRNKRLSNGKCLGRAGGVSDAGGASGAGSTGGASGADGDSVKGDDSDMVWL